MSNDTPVAFQLWELELRLSEPSEPLNTAVLARDEAVTYPEFLLLRAGRGADAIMNAKPVGEIKMTPRDLWLHMVRRYGLRAVGKLWPDEFATLPHADPSRPTPAPKKGLTKAVRVGGVEVVAPDARMAALHLTPDYGDNDAADLDAVLGLGVGLPPQGGDQAGAPA